MRDCCALRRRILEKTRREIIEVRESTRAELLRRGFTLTDSKANFIFAKHGSISGYDFYSKIKQKGVLVRHFSGERIKDYNRITVGSAEQMRAFLAAVDEIITEEKNNAQSGNRRKTLETDIRLTLDLTERVSRLTQAAGFLTIC